MLQPGCLGGARANGIVGCPRGVAIIWMTGQLTMKGIQLVIMIILCVQGNVDFFYSTPCDVMNPMMNYLLNHHCIGGMNHPQMVGLWPLT